MNKQYFEKIFSTERMLKFFNHYPGDNEKAMKHYHANIALSEAFYPVLSVFEVALRNSINRELTTMFNSTEWYVHFQSTPGLRDLNKDISATQRQITKRGENITAPKMVAELTLGFWVRLFNVEYELILWKHLRLAFPYMPKTNRKRNNVSAPLNRIRNFRNRVYHNEPIAWNFKALEDIHSEIITVLSWMNDRLPVFIKVNDRFAETINKIKAELM